MSLLLIRSVIAVHALSACRRREEKRYDHYFNLTRFIFYRVVEKLFFCFVGVVCACEKTANSKEKRKDMAPNPKDAVHCKYP